MARLVATLVFEEYERKQKVFRTRQDAFCLDEESFINLFRLPKQLVKGICEDLRPEISPTSHARTAISLETQVLCTLRFYSTGSYQKAVGQDLMLTLSQASVSRCVKRVTEAINKLMLKREVFFPGSQDYPLIKANFMRYSGFPGVIGAIDCTHIAILAPPHPLDDCYINRKGFFSINVQLVCDTDMRILNINARYPGCSHDAFIWRNSPMRQILQNRLAANGVNNSWLLGDSGYPQEEYLMTPFLNPSSEPESKYNRAHIRGRNVIERCNGLLKSRFRCLLKHRTLNLSPTVASNVVNACAILHNMCIKNRVDTSDIDTSDEESNDDDDEEEDDADDDSEELPKNKKDRISKGVRARAAIIKKHFS